MVLCDWTNLRFLDRKKGIFLSGITSYHVGAKLLLSGGDIKEPLLLEIIEKTGEYEYKVRELFQTVKVDVR